MKNFPFKHGSKTYWYSRSIVSSAYVYCKHNKEWYILSVQRGPGSTQPGLWNVPGGFLDHHETTRQAAQRETWEETGVRLPEGGFQLADIDSTPRGRLEHIRFSYVCDMGDRKRLPDVSEAFSEFGEDERIAWLSVQQLIDHPAEKQFWIDNQYDNIIRFYHKHIHPSLWQWIKNKIADHIDH